MSSNGATSTSGGNSLNPFARRDEYTRNQVLFFKVATLVSYIMLLVSGFYFEFAAPHDGHKPHGSIWHFNRRTPFTQNIIITSLYWLALLVLQIVPLISLYRSPSSPYALGTAHLASHYILSNLLLFAFLQLWTRALFWPALLFIVLNFFNLSLAYFRHSTTPRLVHISVVSGPLAWNFTALYWVGAVAIGTNNLAARIVANIFIWGFLVYGAFFLVAFKDYTMGFALSILSFSTGVSQFFAKVFAFQWIFAFTIGAVLFVLSLLVGLPGLVGRDDLFQRGEVVSEDRERAPLLADD